MRLTVPPGQTACRNVTQANQGGDRAALNICAGNLDPSSASLLETPPPTVDQLFCEGTGATAYACDASVTVPDGPSTVDWYVNDQRVASFHNQTSVAGACTHNATVRVRVDVTDEPQRTASRSTTVRCTAL